MTESQKEKLMRTLGCTEEEALDIIASDKAIDQGKRVEFDLDPEREKMAKKMANAGTKKPTVYKFNTKDKKRKENPTKAGIIEYLFECLKDYDNVVISNKERQITFSTAGENYELTLVQKRKPK